MGTLTQEGKKALAGGGIVSAFLSLHSATPDDTGSNELVGAPYARQEVTFDAPIDGSGNTITIDGNNLPQTFDVAGGDTAAHMGLFSLLTGGVFWGESDMADATNPTDFEVRVNSAQFLVTD